MSINSYFTWHRWKRRCFFLHKILEVYFLRIEEMKNVDIRIVDPESLVSINFLTYTTCI